MFFLPITNLQSEKKVVWMAPYLICIKNQKIAIVKTTMKSLFHKWKFNYRAPFQSVIMSVWFGVLFEKDSRKQETPPIKYPEIHNSAFFSESTLLCNRNNEFINRLIRYIPWYQATPFMVMLSSGWTIAFHAAEYDQGPASGIPGISGKSGNCTFLEAIERDDINVVVGWSSTQQE